MNIDSESSQQQDINDTPITHFDETRENGSDSNFIFEKSETVYLNQTNAAEKLIHKTISLQKETLWSRQIEIFIAVQTCQNSTIFMFAAILRYSSGRSISSTCLTDVSKTIRNKEKVNINVLQFK